MSITVTCHVSPCLASLIACFKTAWSSSRIVGTVYDICHNLQGSIQCRYQNVDLM